MPTLFVRQLEELINQTCYQLGVIGDSFHHIFSRLSTE